jgi:hypothetical protein
MRALRKVFLKVCLAAPLRFHQNWPDQNGFAFREVSVRRHSMISRIPIILLIGLAFTAARSEGGLLGRTTRWNNEARHSFAKSQNFMIPLIVDKEQIDRIESIQLLVSINDGNSWNVYGQVSPKRDHFVFRAPMDGVYWFSFQVVLKDGSKQPSETKNLVACQKLVVETFSSEILDSTPVKPSPSEARRIRNRIDDLQREIVKLRSQLAEIEE